MVELAHLKSRAPAGWNWRKGLTRPLPQYPPIVARESDEPVELSFGQQRLWFLSQLEAGSAAYNVPMAWRITGPLDHAALQRGLDRLVARHEALRTSFPAEDGRPRQVIGSAQRLQMESVDLPKVESSERESELECLLEAYAQRPFDLITGPVLRAALFRVGEEDHVFVLVLHHIVCDGPSIAILLEELGQFYAGQMQGRAVDIPAPPVQYADFAIWQHRALSDDARATQLAYWREQLRNCPVALDFPSDHTGPVRTRFRGGMEQRNLSREVSDELRSLARQHGVTRFMALLALLQVLLARYTGQDEISVGCPMTHRIRAEVTRVVGFFANMMVLRLGLGDNPTIRELLQRTREAALGAYAHQDLPFEQLVAELQPERVAGRNPFFQVMLVVEESFWRELKLAGSRCTVFPVHNGTAKFDFSFYVIDHPEGLRLTLEYDSDRFEAETAQRLLEYYENLLQAVIVDPGCRVFDLPLLSSAERERALRDGNQTREDFPETGTVPQLFEAWARKTPAAVAVNCEGRELSYRALNSRANELAHHLVRLGVGPEVLVAISVERSFDLVVAMLAVMKAGGAYVPLDPSHPQERRETIRRDCEAKILLTDQVETRDPGETGASITVPPLHGENSPQNKENLSTVVQTSDLACVIYTSGSTGRPKGVQVEHRNLSNLLSSMRKCPGLAASDTLLAVTTVAFDIAGLELWLPLTTGATVLLASRAQAADPNQLMRILQESHVTIMQATPATWEMLMAAGWGGTPGLRALCGGEALSGALADQMLTRCRSLWNLYGPTETTIWSSIHRVTMGEAPVVPIGRPIANTTMYVLDQKMEPVPPGVGGELYIGGAGVARGYLDATQLTAERFVADPFSTENGSRLYRTGDAVRQRRDGTLEFLGRRDRQTKIRGYRIEPAEIEAALRDYPGLQQAAVMVREHAAQKRLVGYLVPENADGTFESAQLTRFLRNRLPEYMIPSAFVLLKAFPLTPNGKLDWKAFPAPAVTSEVGSFIAPRDATENRLAAIWSEVLDVRPVGVTDSFFDLGGHSIMATRLFARVEKAFGKRLPLGTLFEAPTIEQLAAILKRDSWVSCPLVAVQTGNPERTPLFLVEARVGYRALAAELGADQPVYVVPYDDLLISNPERELSDLAEELIRRIRAQQPQGPYSLGGWCLAGRVAYAVARELRIQGEEVALLAIIDMSAPGYSQLHRLPGFRGLGGRTKWHLHYALHGNQQQKLDWIAGGFRALSWQVRYRSWQAARLFFRRIDRPLPTSLRHARRLTAEAADKETRTSYPGRITLFRPSEKTFTRNDSWDLGWSQVAEDGVDVHEIAGLKRSLLRSHAIEVGRRLRTCLARAQPSCLATTKEIS